MNMHNKILGTSRLSRNQTNKFFHVGGDAGQHLRWKLKELFETLGEPCRMTFDGIAALRFDRYAPMTNQPYVILLTFNNKVGLFTVRDTTQPNIVSILRIEILTKSGWNTVYQL